MADFIDHLNQAKHNLACAQNILQREPRFRDWSITAAFYSAIHFAEAGFTKTPVKHSETSRQKEDAHHYRTMMIKKYFGQECWMSYRKLSEASYNVRYLAKDMTGEALSYYSEDEAKNFITRDLDKVRREVQKNSGLNLA